MCSAANGSCSGACISRDGVHYIVFMAVVFILHYLYIIQIQQLRNLQHLYYTSIQGRNSR